jgi:hypothetical protein
LSPIRSEYPVTYRSGRTSITCGRRTFCQIFTAPFWEPILCGFFIGGQTHPDARASAIGSYRSSCNTEIPCDGQPQLLVMAFLRAGRGRQGLIIDHSIRATEKAIVCLKKD